MLTVRPMLMNESASFHCCSAFSILSTNDVYDQKDSYPDAVNKVPIQRKHFESLGMSFLHPPGEGDSERDAKHD